MLLGTLSRNVRNSPSALCQRCLLRYLAARRPQTRSVSSGFIATQKKAMKDWDEQAQLIKEGKAPHLWDALKERGYVKDLAGTDEQIRELMRLRRIGAYVGIDPTGPSLHVGHLLVLMPLFWMYIHGFRAITVIGGATARIGDPTDRLQTRDRMTHADSSTYITKIHYQLKRLWANLEIQGKRFGYVKEPRVWSRAIYNNSQWYNSLSFAEIVTRLFSGIRMGPMLSRAAVKRKMEKGDGMSLAEFVYPLMQAWDWWYMFLKLGVRMQIGGSDQYGNIVSGVESIKLIRDNETNSLEKLPDDLLHTPVGFTVPLLTDSSGAKLGKSSGNAVWLDQFMTSTFDLYGYFMRRPDADVEKLLKLLTFFPLEKISEIMEQQNAEPSKRYAQHALAYQVVALVHGLDEAEKIQNIHRGLFSKTVSAPRLSYPTKEPATANLASAFQVDVKLPVSLIMGKSISRILYAAGLADSTTDGNRLAQHEGAYVAGAPGQPAAYNKGMSHGDLTFTPIKNWFPGDTKNFLIDEKILILRRGKHFIRVVEMIDDDEWEASGLMYPGEPGTGLVRQFRDATTRITQDKNIPMSPNLLDAAEILYESKRTKFSDATSSRLQVQSNRARRILEQSFRPYRATGPHSTREKTEAIDSVLESIGKYVDDQIAAELTLKEKEAKAAKKRQRRKEARLKSAGEKKYENKAYEEKVDEEVEEEADEEEADGEKTDEKKTDV